MALAKARGLCCRVSRRRALPWLAANLWGEAYCPAAYTAGYRNIAPHGACRAPASVKSASETTDKRGTRDFSKSHCVSCGSERPHISSATSCGAAQSRNGVSQSSRPVLSHFAATRTAVACRELGEDLRPPAIAVVGIPRLTALVGQPPRPLARNEAGGCVGADRHTLPRGSVCMKSVLFISCRCCALRDTVLLCRSLP